MLDVQVEGVMRPSVARLGYEWTRTRRREKQLAEALVHLRRELHACPRHRSTVTLLVLLAGRFAFFSFSLFHLCHLFRLFHIFHLFHFVHLFHFFTFFTFISLFSFFHFFLFVFHFLSLFTLVSFFTFFIHFSLFLLLEPFSSVVTYLT